MPLRALLSWPLSGGRLMLLLVGAAFAVASLLQQKLQQKTENPYSSHKVGSGISTRFMQLWH